MRLQFSRIHNKSIFNSDFETLTVQNGTIEFKQQNHAHGGIAVVYAPNGIGKSSFAETISNTTSSDDFAFSAVDENGRTLSPEDNAFRVIGDQISRHIIQGDESQYLVGAEIRREYELKKRVEEGFAAAFKEQLVTLYKRDYGVSKVTDVLLNYVQATSVNAYTFIRSIVNTRSRGSDINHADFMAYIRNPQNRVTVEELEDAKRQYVIQDCQKSKIVSLLMSLDSAIIRPSEEIPVIERHDDAIHILKKYPGVQSCIVCDNEDFDNASILQRKQANRERIYNNLDRETKKILDKIVMDISLLNNDPFRIKDIVMGFISSGDPTGFLTLREELKRYLDNIAKDMILKLIDCFEGTSIIRDFDELSQLRENEPTLDSDDLIYIQDVISENIDRDIKVVRSDDGEKNFQLLLGDAPLLNVERENMHLSTGEQNFISLAFELLLAKNSPEEYIVLDDPISSFDSVYKNKIAYCIIKFLENKKQIVLTHNLDLVRLLEVQLKGCFNLYMLSNSEGGRNGFIRVLPEEQKLLINLSDLISLFQNKSNSLLPAITDRKLFLMAMIPFMRGYAHITHDSNDNYGKLSRLMHGYESESLDLVPVYNELFDSVFEGSEEVSVEDILDLQCDDLSFIDENRFPLLAETLRQTLIYYHLRMIVEKKLVDTFHIQIRPGDIVMLTNIIQRAFRCNGDDPDYNAKRNYRVFFASRKTLLNEFNHFEGNINIFQPAIDIAANRLQQEVLSIEAKLQEIENRYSMFAQSE